MTTHVEPNVIVMYTMGQKKLHYFIFATTSLNHFCQNRHVHSVRCPVNTQLRKHIIQTNQLPTTFKNVINFLVDLSFPM